MRAPGPILVGVDAGASRSAAVAVTADGARIGRADGGGANPKRQGLSEAAATIAALARVAASTPPAAGVPAVDRGPALLLVAGAGIDRPEQARTLGAAIGERLSGTRVLVVNDTLAILRAATPDAVGLVVPVSTGGNVIGRAADGRVTDRGHGIFGGGYVLGALAARAARAGRVRGEAPDDEPSRAHRRGAIGRVLADEVAAASIAWVGSRRPAPEVASLGAVVARAAEAGDPYPARMVDRWCGRVTEAIREEVARLELGDRPMVVVHGGLADAVPWLARRVRAAVRAGAPGARLVDLDRDPVDGAVDLALDAWRGHPVGWSFTPRR